MRKLFFFVFVLVCTSHAKSQITLEQTYSGVGKATDVLYLINVGKAGYKYYNFDYQARLFKMYNLNHSVFITYTIPINGNRPVGPYLRVLFISSDVFDCDSSNIELAVVYNNGTPASYVEVIRTDGIVLLHRDSFRVSGSSAGYENPFSHFIVNTPAGAKMILTKEDYINPSITEVYSLCGTLPLSVKRTETFGDNALQLSPNPSSHQTRVEYTLPQGTTEGEVIITDVTGKTIQVFKVYVNFNHILLSNADLPSGTYYYQLHTKEAGTINTKKAIVIK